MKKAKPLHKIIEEHSEQERRSQGLVESNDKLKEELKKWKRKAQYDKLTGLLRKETFDDLLERLIKRAERFDKPLSLLMIDIDYFKRINDTYGHETGNIVLKEVSDIVHENVRQTDLASRTVAGRYGGEEFSVVLPNTDTGGAKVVAERLRKSIQERFKDKETKVTVSIGVSSHDQDEEAEKLYKDADQKLYEAKESGRNKVKY